MAKDIFTELESLTIGQALPATIVAQRQERVSGEKERTEYTYTFTSEAYSHPHLVRTQNEAISFIQLTIPGALQTKYQQLFSSYEIPEITLNKTRSETMYGYPSKGIDFIFDGYSNTITRIQKFPVKPAKEFVQQEGKNFQPVPYQTATSGPAFSSQVSMTSKTQPAVNIGITLLVIVFLLAIFIVGIIIKRKRSHLA